MVGSARLKRPQGLDRTLGIVKTTNPGAFNPEEWPETTDATSAANCAR